MKAYYNEFDPKAAAWLRELIKMGLIMAGDVDERSIIDVEPSDIRGYTRHHFFAGIGGWDYALQLAGWPEDRPVCTASLPCQPFSVAGAGKGKADERHLLPHFLELVRGFGFTTIFGEQVPGAINHGWLDDLCDEMERENYAVRAAVLTAAGAGAPHIRQRLYWMAHSNNTGSQKFVRERDKLQGFAENSFFNSAKRAQESNSSRLVYTNGTGSQPRRELDEAAGFRDTFESASSIGGMGNTEHDGLNANAIRQTIAESQVKSRMQQFKRSNSEWLQCRDGKQRPIKPGIKPLVNGVSRGVGHSSDKGESINANDTQEARVMRLKGYGNAIVPQVAAEFISEFL